MISKPFQPIVFVLFLILSTASCSSLINEVDEKCGRPSPACHYALSKPTTTEDRRYRSVDDYSKNEYSVVCDVNQLTKESEENFTLKADVDDCPIMQDKIYVYFITSDK